MRSIGGRDGLDAVPRTRARVQRSAGGLGGLLARGAWWTHDTGMDRLSTVGAGRTYVGGAVGDMGDDGTKTLAPLATFVALIGLAIWD